MNFCKAQMSIKSSTSYWLSWLCKVQAYQWYFVTQCFIIFGFTITTVYPRPFFRKVSKKICYFDNSKQTAKKGYGVKNPSRSLIYSLSIRRHYKTLPSCALINEIPLAFKWNSIPRNFSIVIRRLLHFYSSIGNSYWLHFILVFIISPHNFYNCHIFIRITLQSSGKCATLYREVLVVLENVFLEIPTYFSMKRRIVKL